MPPGCGSSSTASRRTSRSVTSGSTSTSWPGDRRRSLPTARTTGEPVHFVDGVAFSPDEAYLTLGRNSDAAVTTSDYTGQKIFYRSIQQRSTDCAHRQRLPLALGHRLVLVLVGLRRTEPPRTPDLAAAPPPQRRLPQAGRAWRTAGRSRPASIAGAGSPTGNGWCRTSRSRSSSWPDSCAGSTPRWGCGRSGCVPCGCATPPGSRGRSTRWSPDETYVNVGFWGTVADRPGAADGDVNRRIEAAVADFDGHKSLYSDAYYDRDTFDQLYNVPALTGVKKRYDPDARLDRALREGGDATMTATINPTQVSIAGSAHGSGTRRSSLPVHRVRRQCGRARGLPDPHAPGHRARAVLRPDRTGRPRYGAGLRAGRSARSRASTRAIRTT